MAVANLAVRDVVQQTCDNTAQGVEPISDNLEIARVTPLVVPTQGVGNEIGVLDHPGSLRVYEQRHLREISQRAPAMTVCAELDGKRLQ
jgi:hypothetical protein